MRVNASTPRTKSRFQTPPPQWPRDIEPVNSVVLPDMPSISFSVPTIEPFSFDLALAYLRGSPARIVERLGDRSYHRPIALQGKPALLSVESRETQPAALHVTLRGEKLPTDAENVVRPLVERVFATGVDLSPLLDSIPRHDEFSQELLTRFRGVRPAL